MYKRNVLTFSFLIMLSIIVVACSPASSNSKTTLDKNTTGTPGTALTTHGQTAVASVVSSASTQTAAARSPLLGGKATTTPAPAIKGTLAVPGTMTAALDWNAPWVDFLKNLPAYSYTIPVDELASMVSAGNAPFLLDVRDPEEITQYGHIPGAVNIPYKSVLQNLDKLPNMDQPIVVYSSIGHRGTIILCALRLLGYTDVKELDGGMSIWLTSKYAADNTTPTAPVSQSKPKVDQAKIKDLQALIETGTFGITPDELQSAIDGTSKPVVLDVREPGEIASTGKILNSIHVDLQTLLNDTNVLPADKATFIVIVDTTGHNGTIATMALRMNGYKNVRSLFGGMNEWIKNNHTIVK